ncbi:MAG: hypothetical protein K2X82_00820 [Gemmataceae bacterium]|nr:hypothetical protein [Gemmataceae bacterium]
MTQHIPAPAFDATQAGSYPTFWDAIPVDPPAEPDRPRHRPAPAEDPGPVFLSVEQADVG